MKNLILLGLALTLLVGCDEARIELRKPQIGDKGTIAFTKLDNGDYQFDYTGLGIDANSTHYYTFTYFTNADYTYTNDETKIGVDANPDTWFAHWPDPTDTVDGTQSWELPVPSVDVELKPLIPDESQFELKPTQSVKGELACTINGETLKITYQGLNNGNGEVKIIDVEETDAIN